MPVPSIHIGGGIRRSPAAEKELISIPFPDEPSVYTSFHALRRSASKFTNNNCLGHREKLPDNDFGEYVWKSYDKTYNDVVKLGIGLKIVCGLNSGKTGMEQTRVGIYTMNRPEALESLIAIWSRRAVAVPLYDSLGSNAVTFIVDHSEISIAFLERSKFQNLITGKGAGTLKHLILFEEPTAEERTEASRAGLHLHAYSDLIKAGEGAAADGVEPVPDDWAYVMYTSGTTGDPKGVILTQRNMLSSGVGVVRGTSTDGSIFVLPTDVYISYLPMAHSFEVCLLVSVIVAGASVGFFSGNIQKLVTHDIPRLRPTLMAGVPRVWNRIYHRVMQSIEAKGRAAKMLFDVAYSSQNWCQSSLGMRMPVWDWVLFNTIRKALGGRMRVMASGAAPLSPDLHEFLQVVFGCPVCQGYGMTENAAAATAQGIWYSKPGNIGGPLTATEVKLVDSDDYKTTDVYPKTPEEFEKQLSFKGVFTPSLAGKVVERGEVCLRGHNVFVGYFKMPKETEETLDKEGWLHTGDIGMWEPDGSLCIVDRKKNIFKLAQGEYVSPESVEVAATTSKWIAQIWVYGSSFETCVVAVVVPDFEAFKPWIAEKGLKGSMAEICAMPEVKKMVYDDLVATCRHSKLRSFEIPKDIAFVTEVNDLGQGFTLETDCLTPTLKLRRPQLLKKYQSLIDKLYADVKAREQAEGSH